MTEHTYEEGCKDTLEHMDFVITDAIRRNGGGKTALQILNIFNLFVAELQYQIAFANVEEQEEEERNQEELLNIVEQLFANTPHLRVALKGDK